MATKKQAAPAATTKRGVGYFILALIEQGKSNDQIFAAVQKKFPTARTTKNCVSWYRCNQRLVSA